MPTYCYRRLDTNEIIEVTMTCDAMNRRQLGGEIISLTEAEGGEAGGGTRAIRHYSANTVGHTRPPGNWPRVSEALAVDPSQVPEAIEESRRLGVPTAFDNEGRPVLTGPGHRRKYAKAIGFHPKNDVLG